MKRRKLRRQDGSIVEAVQGPDGHWYVAEDQVGDWIDDMKQIFMPIPTAMEKGARAVMPDVEQRTDAAKGLLVLIVLVVLVGAASKKRGRR